MPIQTLTGATLGLHQTVGLRARNLANDVLRVQDAMNGIPVTEGAPARLLTLDGIAGPKTCRAIQEFQLAHFGWSGADGRVDPAGRTSQKMAALLLQHGTTKWNIRRVEAAVASTSNIAGTRSLDSNDRFFEIGDASGFRRALYYFAPKGESRPPRTHELPPLRDRPEFNSFRTAVHTGVFSFVGDGTYSELSPTPDRAVITMIIRPLAPHAASGAVFNFRVNHRWLEPSTQPGVQNRLTGMLGFVHDRSAGVQKVGKK